MEKLVIATPKQVSVLTVPMPEIRPGEVLVETLVAGVCGSDVHAAQELHPFVPLPYFPGHEVVGIVRDMAPDVKNFSLGDRVTVEPDLPCWNCKNCNNGQINLCENMQFFGCGYEQGGMADFWTLNANRLHKVPSSFSDEEASLIEPLSTPVHATKLSFVGSKDLSGKTVAILGAGTIGLLTLISAKHFNAKKIVMTDMLESKRLRALSMGADAVVDASSEFAIDEVRNHCSGSVDIVFDCVAFQSTMNQAIKMADKGGIVVVIGVPEKDVSIPLPVIQDHQIRIQGSATYLPGDFQDSMEIIGAPNFDASNFVTAVYPKDQAQKALDEAIAGEQVKVLIRFN